MYINEGDFLPINGARQYVCLRGEKAGAPLLLYLHGGPGDAALPLVLKYNRELERHFTVAVWEQRGAGKSYYPFRPGEGLCIETFLADLHALATLLLQKLGQKSLILVGHSWGSVLGLHFVRRYPELVRAYVGCGQVVNMKKSCRTAYEFALAHGDERAVDRLRRIDCSYTGEGWLEDLLFVTRQVVRHGGSLYGRGDYLPLTLPFLTCRHYSPFDLFKRQKGSLQSIQFLWQELMQTDFQGQTQYGAPVFFVEGAHDSHVSSALAREYYESIRSEKQFFWFEDSCHFPQWSEAGRFNRLMAGLFT